MFVVWETKHCRPSQPKGYQDCTSKNRKNIQLFSPLETHQQKLDNEELR